MVSLFLDQQPFFFALEYTSCSCQILWPSLDDEKHDTFFVEHERSTPSRESTHRIPLQNINTSTTLWQIHWPPQPFVYELATYMIPDDCVPLPYPIAGGRLGEVARSEELRLGTSSSGTTNWAQNEHSLTLLYSRVGAHFLSFSSASAKPQLMGKPYTHACQVEGKHMLHKTRKRQYR